ncbi:pectate lyase [Plectosphaerella cucumerina]|uniref:Pectate lyase n=1 Tax=Plectosphaerella cucumerina TaxID=40658 RepID=A0A8K0TIB4_9PEZI|nr:pectate lyase [Plectosphaerella cucumerina]
MHASTLLAAVLAGTAAAQTLTIPKANGSKTVLSSPSIISGVKDFANREFDRGHSCGLDVERPNPQVFILENGATLSNVIIGINAVEGVQCKGSCTLRNVWFRDVCEEAIVPLGTGNVLIEGGGAKGGSGDSIVNHRGASGTITIKDFTVIGGNKLFDSCGNCRNNGSPRNVILQNVKASSVTTLVGINSNFGDVSTISGSCGSGVSKVCQEFRGVATSGAQAVKVSTTANCKGQASLPAC